ncbi:MAG: recombinase family protein [Maricaulaceae bacterium]
MPGSQFLYECFPPSDRPSIKDDDDVVAVIYLRVSDPKQVRDGSGLRSQEHTCRNFARFINATVVGKFSDVISGRSVSRSGMDDMLAFLRKRSMSGERLMVIIDDISRLARNFVGHMELRNEIRLAGGELISPSMEFSDDPVAQLPEKIMALIVEHDRINNAHRSRSRQLARMQSGFWTFPAPRGYTFVKADEGGQILVRDEPDAEILAEALRLFSIGQIQTQMEFKRYLDAEPRFEKGKSGVIHRQKVTRMLTNPLYAGFIDFPAWKISMVRARHDPLISLETHLKIKERLSGRPKFPVRKTVHEDFPLRGFVQCAGCNVPLRGGWSSGKRKKYAYYNCQTKSCEHYGKSIPKAKIEGDFEALLSGLRPGSGLLKVFIDMFEAHWTLQTQNVKSRRDAAAKELRDLDAKLEGLLARVVAATQTRVIEAYEKEIDRIELERAVKVERLERLKQEKAPTNLNTRKAFKNVLAFLASPCNLWRSNRIEIQRTAVKLTFADQLSYCRENGFRTPKTTMPFNMLGGFDMQNREMVPLE